MKAVYPILLGLGMTCSAMSQEITDESTVIDLADEVQKAIQEFNRLKNLGKKPKEEIVVVIPPPEAPSDPVEEEPAYPIPVEHPDTAEEPPTDKIEQEVAAEEPKLVTGVTPVGEPEVPPSAQEEAPSIETTPEEKQGLAIRVESIRDGSGEIDPGKVKLKASFSAKPLSRNPDGWILEKSEQAPAFHEEITLRPGKTISLTIRPHILAPASDGANTFAVVEPGFDVSEGYRQSNTVSAILENSVAQLDRDALLLGNAISDLHQLLASLPKPEPEPEDTPEP
ncbi:MAG: hypothetical protein OSA84_04810 [Akkermansiaceae bacterium]|nr:hypothetical protein [Akkermansiaceae bacterium]